MVEDVEVDTGAFVTSLPIEVSNALGIDVKRGEHVTFSTVTGPGEGWVHALEARVVQLGGGEEDIDGYILGHSGVAYTIGIPVMFYESTRGLLGREGVLKYLSLTFEEHMLTVTAQPD